MCILENVIGGEDTGYEYFENTVFTKQAIDFILTRCHLTPRQKELVESVIYDNKDVSQLYKEWGVSRQNVNLIVHNIREKVERYGKDLMYG